MKKILVFTFIISLFSSVLYASDVLYVQSAKAKIYGSPQFNSRLVGEVKKGDTLEVIMTKDRWYRVKNGELRGWINSLCVSKNKPIDKITVIQDNPIDLENNARRRASTVTSAAAARGLTDEDRHRLSDKKEADYILLKELEEFAKTITDQDIEKFMLSMEGEIK
ncbi:MAG: SH3 domain-containing protein [bacterium]